MPNIGTTIFQYDIIEDMEAGCWAETSTDLKGNRTQKVYDKVGRIQTVTTDITIIDNYIYTYDAAHNQTSKVDAKGPNVTLNTRQKDLIMMNSRMIQLNKESRSTC